MIMTLWSIAAALLAVGLEYTYRVLPAPWTNIWHFALFVLAQCAIGVTIYKIVTVPGASLIGAFIVWASATLVARVLVTIFVLHDRVSPGTWLAVALLIAARAAQALWK